MWPDRLSFLLRLLDLTTYHLLVLLSCSDGGFMWTLVSPPTLLDYNAVVFVDSTPVRHWGMG